jgi:hypothetical protein
MISDDDLLLYYYRELDPTERARIGAALTEQPELARRLHALVARLDAAAASAEVPVPAETQQRWRAALEHAVRKEGGGAARQAPASRFLRQPQWLAAAAAVLVAALIFGVQGVMQSSRDPVTDAVSASTQEPTRNETSSAYEHGLKWHLASTERRLASLGEATPEERARLIETIVGQNRIYALAAERAGEPQLARVLRAFTPVLESVAADDGESTASSVAQLSFELRVMQARLGADAKPPSNIL